MAFDGSYDVIYRNLYDPVFVILLLPLSKLLAIQGHAQNLEEQLWVEGRREVSINYIVGLIFVGVSQHFSNWL